MARGLGGTTVYNRNNFLEEVAAHIKRSKKYKSMSHFLYVAARNQIQSDKEEERWGT